MNYKDNAPRDYPTYYRDLRLYYQDLLASRERLDRIIGAFANGRFDQGLDGQPMQAEPRLDAATSLAASQLQETWEAFERTLQAKLGEDAEEPRLEWAAEWVLEHSRQLEQATSHLLHTLERGVDGRTQGAQLFGRLALVFSLIAAALILAWFYLRVLRPLQTAVSGFDRAATGDFSPLIAPSRGDEIGRMIQAFNQLSARLNALLTLITRLQETQTLDDTLEVLSGTLPGLVPLDWVGIVIQGPDGRGRLEQAFADGRPDSMAQQAFDLDGTLLQECLRTNTPLHIADVRETSMLDSRYKFLGFLQALGRQEAVFMPISGNGSVTGVAVFASRHPNTYRPQHLELLYNLSHLFSVSFGRNVTLAESSRLATIGQFASGIVHEIRNPLATINLALEHFLGLDGLADSGRRRAELASREVGRLSRLLDDILLYAKPMQLALEDYTLARLFEELQETPLLDHPLVQVAQDTLRTLPPVQIDRDRMKQVMVNLLGNAVEANGDDPRGVHVNGYRGEPQDMITLEVVNGGKTLGEEELKRVFEPFYTSKHSGTGLGLPIVKRIVRAHGGKVDITSSTAHGTRVSVLLPIATAPSA
jgi:signal transduction histidine kinase